MKIWVEAATMSPAHAETQIEHALAAFQRMQAAKSRQYDDARKNHKTVLLSDPEELRELVERYDTFLFDCDGVLWTGPELLGRTSEVILALRCVPALVCVHVCARTRGWWVGG